MNRQRLNPTIFSQLGNLYTVAVFRIPAGTNFQRHWHIHCVNNRGQDRLHLLGILQQGRARQLTIHLFSRAPHIDINNLGAIFHVDTRGLGHLIRYAAGNLHGANTWLIDMNHP